jgi:hypothetical protein
MAAMDLDAQDQFSHSDRSDLGDHEWDSNCPGQGRIGHPNSGTNSSNGDFDLYRK